MPEVSTAPTPGTTLPIQKGSGVQTGSNNVPIAEKGRGYAVINGENIAGKSEAPSSPEALPVSGGVHQEEPPSPVSVLLPGQTLPAPAPRTPRSVALTSPSLVPKISTSTTDAIRVFSVFNTSPQLKSFREQMVKEGAIQASDFVKINNNADMEQFLLKLVAWKAKSAGATDAQIQHSLANISKGFSALRSGR